MLEHQAKLRRERDDAINNRVRLQERFVQTASDLAESQKSLRIAIGDLQGTHAVLSHPLHRCADSIIRAVRVLSAQLRALRG